MSDKQSDNLKERSNQFFCVFNDNELNLFKNSNYIFSKIMKCNSLDVGFIALIKHENEWDSEEKKIKVPHYHVFFNLKFQQICSCNTILNIIVELFHCNREQISIRKATDVVKCVRYLCHLDDMDKDKYLPFDIVSNDDKKVGDYMSMTLVINDVRDLVSVVKRHNYNLESIILSIGNKNYKTYRQVIGDLIRQVRL